MFDITKFYLLSFLFFALILEKFDAEYVNDFDCRDETEAKEKS